MFICLFVHTVPYLLDIVVFVDPLSFEHFELNTVRGEILNLVCQLRRLLEKFLATTPLGVVPDLRCT